MPLRPILLILPEPINIRAYNNSPRMLECVFNRYRRNIDTPPSPPPTPLSSGNSCGDVTLSYNGTPGAGIWWCWQNSPSNPSTINKLPTYIVSSSGTYYLFSYNNVNGCWSTGYSQIAVTVNQPPATPSNPTASTNTCGDKTLTLTGTPPGGVTWYGKTQILRGPAQPIRALPILPQPPAPTISEPGTILRYVGALPVPA